jgi:hypothetical protein
MPSACKYQVLLQVRFINAKMNTFGVKPAILKCLFQLPAQYVAKNTLEAIVLLSKNFWKEILKKNTKMKSKNYKKNRRSLNVRSNTFRCNIAIFSIKMVIPKQNSRIGFEMMCLPVAQFDRKDMRCGFRVHLEKQMKVLESASKKCHTKLLPCQIGFLISSKALPLLYEVFHINVRTGLPDHTMH